MAIDELPAAPDPATDQPQVFNQKAAAMVLALKAMIPQLNAALGQFNASLAGGAYALAYLFDATTADADPGPGRLRLSSATQNAATVLRLDVSAGGVDVSGILDAFDASTSTVKGSVRLVKVGDPSKWLTFDVTARAAPAGYRNFSVANTGGSAASPFVAGDGVLVFFQRNGDKGQAGDMIAPMLHVREEYAAGTSAPSIVNNQVRNLNATYANTIAGASVSAGVITLPPGTYDFDGGASIASSVSHRVYLWNGTDSNFQMIGSTLNQAGWSSVKGRVSWSTGNKQFSLKHVVTTSATGGSAINGGTVEPYAEMIFRKVG